MTVTLNPFPVSISGVVSKKWFFPVLKLVSTMIIHGILNYWPQFLSFPSASVGSAPDSTQPAHQGSLRALPCMSSEEHSSMIYYFPYEKNFWWFPLKLLSTCLLPVIQFLEIKSKSADCTFSPPVYYSAHCNQTSTHITPLELLWP